MTGSSHLGAMLDGYFHQDFMTEYGSHEDAARAFARDASRAERLLVASELEAFLAQAELETRQEWLRRLKAIGGAWRPRSLGSVKKVAAVLAGDV